MPPSNPKEAHGSIPIIMYDLKKDSIYLNLLYSIEGRERCSTRTLDYASLSHHVGGATHLGSHKGCIYSSRYHEGVHGMVEDGKTNPIRN